MAYEHKEGAGTLFKNDYKEEGDKRPDLKGSAKWKGKTIEVALWIDRKDGEKTRYSLKLQEPREKSEPKPREDDMGGDFVPF